MMDIRRASTAIKYNLYRVNCKQDSLEKKYDMRPFVMEQHVIETQWLHSKTSSRIQTTGVTDQYSQAPT